MLTEDQERYLKKVSETEITRIIPYDLKAAEFAKKLINELQDSSGLEVLWSGALALGISGSNDIDITIFGNPKDFETIAASCPVPIVIAGGKKITELDALKMAYRSIQEGAAGVDMGRNIFQTDTPIAMIQAVRAVVHENETPEKAFDLYNTLKNTES